MKKEDNKIPTASQILKNWGCVNQIDGSDINDGIEAMLEFAKLHVKAALNLAYQKSEVYNKSKFPGDINYQVDPDSILNAYPLDNIK